MSRILVVVGLVSAAAIGLIAGASRIEENDAFCASCHRAPEVLYVQRADQARTNTGDAADLASRHAAIPARCVDCHRGDNGIVHRSVSLALGARNAALFALGQGSEGKTALLWLPEASCAACHTDVWSQEGFEKHFHNMLQEYHSLPQVKAKPTNRILCVDCHPAHAEAEALAGFIDKGVVFPVCEKCHQVWERGPRKLSPG